MMTLRGLLKELIVRAKCMFVSHEMTEKDYQQFKNNPYEELTINCKTCNHPLLARKHPVKNTYMLIEV